MIQVPNIVSWGGINIYQPTTADEDIDIGGQDEITDIRIRILDDDYEPVNLNGAITTWAFSFHS